MKASTLSGAAHLATTPKPRRLDAFACRAVRRRFELIEHGAIRLHDGAQYVSYGEPWGQAVLRAEIHVHDGSFYSDVAFGGSIGAGEAYMQGTWDCDDLVALVRILLRNRRVLDEMERGAARLTRPLQRLFHWFNRNTREGARRNISAHYDLGNEFFALWLDQTMMYSSAMFPDPAMSLHEAQLHRLGVICDKLDLQPTDHLVEIGTGWGGLAIHAASHYGCRVTTTTLSREQREWAQRAVQEAGLEGQVTVLLDDFRDLDGQYDKLVSIEMIEAIGSDLYDAYFRKCAGLLKPGGRMLIQAITIAERQYVYAQRNVDFIQRYIFPGSCLPCLSVMTGTIARVSDLQVIGLEDIGADYALTLNRWRRNFSDNLDAVRALGYPEAFLRMWAFYLCYCEGGFIERAVSDMQLLAERPG